MTTAKRGLLRGLLGVIAAGAVVATGCQTRLGGVPYPTPHYLQHYPTYLGQDPAFPLQRERDSMLDPTGEIRRGAAVAPALGAPPEGGVGAPVPTGPGR